MNKLIASVVEEDSLDVSFYTTIESLTVSSPSKFTTAFEMELRSPNKKDQEIVQ